MSAADGERLLLALETSTPTADVVVADAAGKVWARRTAVAARHSANLLSLCAEALAEAGVAVPELAAVACGAGPGSFTGLRVGMAVAKGLAMPFDLSFLAVSSLAALARGLRVAAPGEACWAACLDGGKGQIFGAFFVAEPDADGLVQTGETLAAVPDGFAAAAPSGAIFAGGPGLALFRETPAGWTLGPRLTPPAQAVAELAWRRLQRGERDDLASAVPVYGRAPDITTPKPRPSRG